MGVVRIGLICGRMGRYISVIVGIISYFEVMRFDAIFLKEHDLLGASKTCALTAGPTTYHRSPSHRRARANPRPTIASLSLAPPNFYSSPAMKPAIAGGW